MYLYRQWLCNKENMMGVLRFNGLVVLAAVSVAGLYAADDIRLANAVQNQDSATVRELLKQHVDVNAMQPDGMTALIWAAHNDDLETADALVKAGANVKALNRYGVQAIGEAAANGSAPMVELLLKAGADPNTELTEGETILMAASRTGNEAVVKTLLDHNARVNAKEGWHGETALMWAAGENHAGVVKLLVEHGADVNAQATHLIYPDMKKGPATVFSSYPPGGLTVLMEAARENAMEAAQALIAAGAKVDQRDPNGLSAMVIAAANTHWDMANLLLEHGADPSDGSLWQAVEMRDSTHIIHASSNHADTLSSLDYIKALLAHGAKPDSMLPHALPAKKALGGQPGAPIDATPLYRAAKSADLPVMQQLLEKGADARHAGKNGSTPLMSAAQSGVVGAGGTSGEQAAPEEDLIAAIKLCMEYGADINAADATGQTALHLAASKGSDRIVEYLAKHGAKLDAKDKRDRTPLDVAMGVGGGPAAVGGGVTRNVEAHESTAALLRKLMGVPEEAKSGDGKKPAEPKEVAQK
jgi:ankyrin repeat protein